MTKKRWLVLAIVVVLAAGITAAVAANRWGGWHHGHHAEHVMEHITDELDLDASQQEKLRAIKDELMAGREEFKDQRTVLMNELIEQVSQPEADRDALLDMIERPQAWINEWSPRVVDRFLDLHRSLNDTQRAQVVAHLERARDRRHRHHH